MKFAFLLLDRYKFSFEVSRYRPKRAIPITATGRISNTFLPSNEIEPTDILKPRVAAPPKFPLHEVEPEVEPLDDLGVLEANFISEVKHNLEVTNDVNKQIDKDVYELNLDAPLFPSVVPTLTRKERLDVLSQLDPTEVKRIRKLKKLPITSVEPVKHPEPSAKKRLAENKELNESQIFLNGKRVSVEKFIDMSYDYVSPALLKKKPAKKKITMSPDLKVKLNKRKKTVKSKSKK